MFGHAAAAAVAVDVAALAAECEVAVVFEAVVGYARVEAVAIAPLAVAPIVAAGREGELAVRRRSRGQPVCLPRVAADSRAGLLVYDQLMEICRRPALVPAQDSVVDPEGLKSRIARAAYDQARAFAHPPVFVRAVAPCPPA
jgi:hypothetical protein